MAGWAVCPVRGGEEDVRVENLIEHILHFHSCLFLASLFYLWLHRDAFQSACEGDREPECVWACRPHVVRGGHRTALCAHR